jgi:indolepyruvate ferredoxin oxidoreductase beta subunit
MIKFDNNNNNYNADIRKVSGRVASSLRDGYTISVLFAGVGGQGIILATTLLARAAIAEGFDVKVSEVHGMAQRGGSVEGSVRFGKKVLSPTTGCADFVVALEKLEGLRFLGRLGENGLIIINDYKIYPLSAYKKDSRYPDSIEQVVRQYSSGSIFVDAFGIAKELGESRAANVVILGALSVFLPFGPGNWEEVIKTSVPAGARELNIKAFKAGREFITFYDRRGSCP